MWRVYRLHNWNVYETFLWRSKNCEGKKSVLRRRKGTIIDFSPLKGWKWKLFVITRGTLVIERFTLKQISVRWDANWILVPCLFLVLTWLIIIFSKRCDLIHIVIVWFLHWRKKQIQVFRCHLIPLYYYYHLAIVMCLRWTLT